ncbi:MAG: NAD(P)/FAD-dependent oxidoreductase [Chloroflexi bacterium]|nr:NAD(P)/FAD-dependent oxidoreductase [Chloroflexota bacterium]
MHDVIVMGAGPAGNMTALRLAELGHEVLVLDWRETLGDKLCTGIIGNECAAYFPPDDAHIYHEARSATIVSPKGRRLRVEKASAQALIVDRVAYVGSVADRAREAGAEFVLGARVTGVDISSDGVTVRTEASAGVRSHRGKMAVVAGGFNSPLVRMTGLGSDGPQDFMIGSQAEVEAPDLRETEVYLGNEVSPKSFAWLVPVSEGRALVGLVSRERLNGHADSFLESLRRQSKIGKLIKGPRSWGIPVKPLPRTYGDRVLVTGDAAGLVKPTTGGGIYYSFISGDAAAQTADEAIEADDFSSRRLRGYEKRWKSVFGNELQIGYHARAFYESLSDDQIERMFGEFLDKDALNDVINSDDFSFDWHGKAILKVLRHSSLLQVVKSLGPAAAPFLARVFRSGG